MYIFNNLIEISEFNGYLNREIVLKLESGKILRGEIRKVIKVNKVKPEQMNNLTKKQHVSPLTILFKPSNDNEQHIELNIKDIFQFEFIY